MTKVGYGDLLKVPTLRSGPSGPVNTVPPAIPASAVIGTQLVTTPGTWNGTYTLTYQWQRNTGSWVNIGGATSANYTPVDADFGRALRVVETADGAVSANSNETGLTAEAPVQSLGAELFVNNEFSTYSAGFTGWMLSPGTYGGDPGVTEVDPSGGAGTGAAKFSSSSTSVAVLSQPNTLLANVYYETVIAVTARVSGYIVFRSNAVGSGFFVISAVRTARNLFLSTVNDGAGLRNSQITDMTVDSTSLKAVTLNNQLTAPTSDMIINCFYTLPGTPQQGDQIWLISRASDFAAGNYWLTLLEYTGSQWNITLFSVASHTRTSRIAATNIGTTNGIRIDALEDDWTLYTTVDGGNNWTSRGTVTNNTYEAATGVNVLWTSPVTMGNLAYINP